MKCPLMLMNWKPKETEKHFRPFDCLKEECAWWNESVEKCCVPVLAANAIVLNLFMQEIVEKMPKREQFGK